MAAANQPTVVTATAAARSFSDLLARVRYRSEEFIVSKAGEPMCRIVPFTRTAVRSTAATLARVVALLPKPDAEYLKQVESVAKRQPKAPRAPWGR